MARSASLLSLKKVEATDYGSLMLTFERPDFIFECASIERDNIADCICRAYDSVTIG